MITSVFKVVHVLPIFPSKSETFIINFIEATIKENYGVQILANQIEPIERSSQKQILDYNNLYSNAETYNPYIYENKLKRLLQALWILTKNLRYASILLRTLNRKRYGLKARTLKMWFQASVFLKHRDAKIFHAHFGINGKLLAEMKEIGAIEGEIITSFYGYDTFSTFETRFKLQQFFNSTFECSKYLITSSLYLKNNLMLLNAPESSILVNPVGVDVNFFSYKKRKYSGILKMITVGRLIKLKGQDIGLEIVKELKAKGYDVSYTIVGYGEEEQSLKERVKQLKIEREVEFYGSASQHEILKLLHEHHLFLMTSITNSMGRAEGQGLVSAEAQSTGIPVIGFDSGGISETIKDGSTGFIVKEGDVEAMAKRIEEFLRNPRLLHVMGLEARQFIEMDFNNTVQSKEIMDLYCESIN